MIIISIILLRVFGVSFGMDLILVTFAIFALISKRGKDFLADWIVPMILFYLYEALRGNAFNFSSKVLHIEVIVEPLIRLERLLFFYLPDIPTVLLQNILHPDIGVVYWYDYFLSFFYVSFFWFWILIGFILWRKNRLLFKKYIYGLLVLSFVSTFIFYLFFPTAPPWWSSEFGYLPHLERVMWIALSQNNEVSILSTYARNDFAAFPSLHAAWPFYASLFVVYIWGKKYVWVFIIPILIAFATWYGAEHYVVDSLAGFILAYMSFYIFTRKKLERCCFTRS